MKHLLIVLSLAALLHAVMAMPFERTFTQSDGSTFKAHAKGDEYLHYIETPSGDILLYNEKTKNYEYATIKGTRLLPSGLPYKKRALKSSVARQSSIFISKKDLERLRQRAMKHFPNGHLKK